MDQKRKEKQKEGIKGNFYPKDPTLILQNKYMYENECSETAFMPFLYCCISALHVSDKIQGFNYRVALSIEFSSVAQVLQQSRWRREALINTFILSDHTSLTQVLGGEVCRKSHLPHPPSWQTRLLHQGKKGITRRFHTRKHGMS